MAGPRRTCGRITPQLDVCLEYFVDLCAEHGAEYDDKHL